MPGQMNKLGSTDGLAQVGNAEKLYVCMYVAVDAANTINYSRPAAAFSNETFCVWRHIRFITLIL